MNRASIMQRYEKALELTRAMLEAAQKSDWERLVALEQERGAIIDQLRELDRDAGRDASLRKRKRELIRDIMRCDEQVQVLTQDWMHELREVLGSVGAEQRLSRTSGA